MEEAVSTFQSVVEAEQQNDGPYQKRPLIENENPTRNSNQKQGMDEATNRRKGVERNPIAVGVETRVEIGEK